MKNRNYCHILTTLFIVWAMAAMPVLAISAGTQNISQQNGQQTRQADDGGFPRPYKLASGTAVLYQPQIANWDKHEKIVAWSAVSYEPSDKKQTAALGTIKIEAETRVALDERVVNFTPLRITQFNFHSLSRDQAQTLASEMQKAFSPDERTIALDRMLAAVDKSQITAPVTAAGGVKADPPKLFYSTTPAILVNFDSGPVWSPIKDIDLKFAVNTNWDIFEHTPSKTLYLRNESAWLKAADINGPWSSAGQLPESFAKLPADDNWKEVKANLPGNSANSVPTVFVSNEPAELILMQGQPRYTPVPGTGLLWVNNTESDVFRAGKNGAFYYLVAGRWFSAPDLNGPWTFATPSLPADFQKIPVEHPRSRVLASVPGTDQAAEAILLAQVPRSARVNTKEIKAPEVSYQGEPDFKPIEGTKLTRAVNTDKDVIRLGSKYYLCVNAVWFTSGNAAGPWEVARSIPQEIYEIPATSAAHHVTYVTVQKDDNDNDDWVTFAYVAGYTGVMIAWGCAVWGTGWYYPPYFWYGGFYPAYFWYPRTYGFSAWYNPWTGTYGRGASVYGPYGGAGAFAAYNPRTVTYARGGAVYGPYNARGFAQAWNPRTGTYAQTRQGAGIYGNWGSSYVQRGDDWARTGHITNYATGTTTRGIRTDDGGAITRKGPDGRTTIAKGQGGDVYAGHDGNVYRKDNGSWQKWDDGGWNTVEKPDGKISGQTRDNPTSAKVGGKGSTRIEAPTHDQLERDSINRAEGNRRTLDQHNYDRDLGGRSFGGSFRRGGGGRFRRR